MKYRILLLLLLFFVNFVKAQTSPYKLPFPPGNNVRCTRSIGHGNVFNGTEQYAYDFKVDNPIVYVVASRGGCVRKVKNNSNVCGCSQTYSGDANYVVITHGDGTEALYLHFQYNSIVVGLNQIVSQGDTLGIMGETGYTCGCSNTCCFSHLHFQVQNSPTNGCNNQSASWHSASIDIPGFWDVNTSNNEPVEGGYPYTYYTSLPFYKINNNLEIYAGPRDAPYNNVKIWCDWTNGNSNFTIANVTVHGMTPVTLPNSAVSGKNYFSSIGKALFKVDFSAGNLLALSPYDPLVKNGPYAISFDLYDQNNVLQQHYYSDQKLYFLHSSNVTGINLSGDWNMYISKGMLNGLFKGFKQNNSIVFQPGDPLTKGQAAKVVLAAILRLNDNIPVINSGTYPTGVDPNSELFPYILTAYTQNWLPTVNNTYNQNDPITLGEFAYIINKAFNLSPVTASDKPKSYQSRIFIKNSLIYQPSIEALLNTFFENNLGSVENLLSGFIKSSGNSSATSTTKDTVNANQPVVRAMMAKAITNAYIWKAKKLGSAYYKTTGGNGPSDYFVIGDKYESVNQPTGVAPALSPQIQSSYTINDNDSLTISHASDYDAANNGAPLYFYWTAGGGDTLKPLTSNFRSVRFIPGAVSQPTTFKLYTQCGNTNGKIREYYIDVNVNPTNPSSTTTVPTIQAANLQFPNNGYNDILATWTRGNGTKCIVTCTPANDVPVLPQAGMVYTGNSNYNLAPAINNSTTKVVYTGVTGSENITGLLQNTAYRIQVFEYNGNTNATVKYNLNNYPSAITQTAVVIPTQSNFTWSGYPIIAGTSYQFLSTAQNANGFSWSVSPNASISTPTQAATNITFPSAGTYNVSLTASNSYTNQSSTHTEPITVLTANSIQPLSAPHLLDRCPVFLS